MKFPTIKCASGMEVSLAAFLFKMTSLNAGQVQRPVGVGVKDTGTPSLKNRKEGRDEDRSFQR